MKKTPQDEIVLAAIRDGGRQLTVTIYSVSSSGVPFSTSNITVKPPQMPADVLFGLCSLTKPIFGDVAVTTGNVDGSGNDAIIVAAQVVQTGLRCDNTLVAGVATGTALYVFTASSDLTTLTQHGPSDGYLLEKSLASYSLDYIDFSLFTVAVVAAPFLGLEQGTEQVGVVWQKFTDGSSRLTTFTSLVAIAPLLPSNLVVKELVKETDTGMWGPNEFVVGRVTAGALAYWTANSASVELIVGMACPNCFGQVAAFTYTPTSGAPQVQKLGQSQLSAPRVRKGGGAVQVVVGDFRGESWLAKLVGHTPLSEVKQVQLFIAAPPTHLDVFPDIGATNPITISLLTPSIACENQQFLAECAGVSYVTKQMVATSQTITTKRHWDVSNTDSVSSLTVSFSVTTSYGQDFEKTTQQIASQTTQAGITVQTDDVLVFTEIDYDIWEYEVIKSPLDPPGTPTYIRVVFPRVQCSASGCVLANTATPQVYAGSDLAWFNPPWLPNYALSYPSLGPSDLVTNVMTTQYATDLGSVFQQTISRQDGNTNTSNTTSNIGVNASLTTKFGFTIFGFPITTEIQFKGGYAQTNINTQTVSYDNSTAVTFNFPLLPSGPNFGPGYGVPSQYRYLVTPWLYDSAAGVMRVYFQVQAPSPQNNTPTALWNVFYGQQPDFAFLLPNRFSNENTQQTADIQVSAPATNTITVGSTALVTATVRNLSLQSFTAITSPLQVLFYLDLPQSGGSQLLATRQVTVLPAQNDPVNPNALAVPLTFTAPSVPGCYRLRVVLNPPGPGQLGEIHYANNVGWAPFVVFGNGPSGVTDNPCGAFMPRLTKGQLTINPHPGGSPRLTVEPSDVRIASVRTLGDRQRLRLSANVHAAGADFANVTVTFYEGDPRRGGRYLGHEVIPLIWAGRVATAAIEWEAPRVGTRDLYVRIDHFSRLASIEKTTARVPVDLATFPAAPPPTPVPTPTLTPVTQPTREPVDVGCVPSNRGNLPLAATPTSTRTPTPTPMPTGTATSVSSR